jgi:hypothetical protein
MCCCCPSQAVVVPAAVAATTKPTQSSRAIASAAATAIAAAVAIAFAAVFTAAGHRHCHGNRRCCCRRLCICCSHRPRLRCHHCRSLHRCLHSHHYCHRRRCCCCRRHRRHFPRGMTCPPLLLLRWQALPVPQCLGAVSRTLSATMMRSSGAVGQPLIARRWRGASASSVVTRSRKDVDCAGANDGALGAVGCLSPLTRVRMSTAAAQTMASRWEQCLV